MPSTSNALPRPSATRLNRAEQATVADQGLAAGGTNNLIPTSIWVLVGAAALTAGALSTRRRTPTAARAGTGSLVSGILPTGGSERATVGDSRLVLINDQYSPTTYLFTVDVPPGGHTGINPDGSATVYDGDGNPVTAIAKPWAYDSLGRPQKTWYTTDANGNLVQHVQASPDALYPILADPPGEGAAPASASAGRMPPGAVPAMAAVPPAGGGAANDGKLPPPADPPPPDGGGTISGDGGTLDTGNGSGNGGSGGGGQSDPVWEPEPEPPAGAPMDSQPSDPGGSGEGGSGEHGGSAPGPGKPPEPVQGNDIDPGFDNVDIPFAGDPAFTINPYPAIDQAFRSIGQPSPFPNNPPPIEVYTDEDGNVWILQQSDPDIYPDGLPPGQSIWKTNIDGKDSSFLLIENPDGTLTVIQGGVEYWFDSAGNLLSTFAPDPGTVEAGSDISDAILVLAPGGALIRIGRGAYSAARAVARSRGESKQDRPAGLEVRKRAALTSRRRQESPAQQNMARSGWSPEMAAPESATGLSRMQ